MAFSKFTQTSTNGYYRYLALERYGVIILISLVGTSLILSFIDGRNVLAQGLLIPVSFLFELATGLR